MNQTISLRSRSLTFSELSTYIFSIVFIAGNILLPRLCHLIPSGGPTWLPIYFFTLIAAYRYGWRVGLLTALTSPVVNHLLFGMPAAAVLMPIAVKSVLLAFAASWFSSRARGVKFWAVASAVLVYQTVGTLAEWAMSSSLSVALNDLTVGLPGIAVQILGGYLLLRLCNRWLDRK